VKLTITLAVIAVWFCVTGTRAQAPPTRLHVDGPVPTTLFGMHLHDVNSVWPDVPVGALGKGSQTAWVYEEPNSPVNGVHKYNWSFLDAWVAMAQAHGVDFYWSNTFVPRWAAADTSTCTYTPVNQPRNNACTGMVANIADWDDFTTAMVTRYGGRIKNYELWNEPDSRQEFTGSVADMVTLTNHFHDVVRAKDPSALIISPSNNGYNTGFMDSYWASGGTKDVDIVSLHAEVDRLAAESILTNLGGRVLSLMAKYGLSNKPLWDTEATAGHLTPDQLMAFVAVDYLLHWSDGISRLYWYQWDYDKPSSSSRLKGSPAAMAYWQVYKWMVGATMSPCSMSSAEAYSAIYSCDLMRGEVRTQVVWDAAGPSEYGVPNGYTTYEDLFGNSHAIGGTTIVIGFSPILLKP
jgi:hypothetical protein